MKTYVYQRIQTAAFPKAYTFVWQCYTDAPLWADRIARDLSADMTLRSSGVRRKIAGTRMYSVLVVDDNDEVREIICEFLKDAGCDVLAVADGTSAIDLIRGGHWDLLITDIFMPDCDGIEVVRAARQHLPSTPILAISGGSVLLPQFNPLKSAEMLGALVTVRKPFTRLDLATALVRVMSHIRPSCPEQCRLAS